MRHFFLFFGVLLCSTSGYSQSVSCQADFTYVVPGWSPGATFYHNSTSTGNIISTIWDFGNGDSLVVAGNSLDTYYDYVCIGVYNVCVTILTDDTCTSTYCDSVPYYYTFATGPPSAGFTYAQNSLLTSFIDSCWFTFGDSTVWDFGDGTSHLGSFYGDTINHIYAAAGTYNACITNYGLCGPPSTFCDTIVVTCSNPPSGFTSTSVGYDTDFQVAVTSFDSTATYSWDFGDGNSSTVFDPSHTYAANGTYVACLTVSDVCGTSSSCDTVVIYCPLPTASFTDSVSFYDATFVAGNSGDSTAIFLWDFGDGNTATGDSVSHAYSAGGTYIVCLIVDGHCGVDTTCQQVVVICPLPVADFSSTTNLLNANFDGTSTMNDSLATYVWDYGDGNSGSGAFVSWNYSSEGTYDVCLTVSTPCGIDSFCQPVEIVCPLPDANFSYDVTNEVVDFFWAPDTLATGWVWDFGDGTSSNDTSPTHVYPWSGGIVTVCLTVVSPCGSTTSCTDVELGVGVDESSSPISNVKLFPNPTANMVTVSVESRSNSPVEVTVSTIDGKILQLPIQWHSRTTATLDGSHLSRGIYILTVRQDDHQVTKRIEKIE